MISDSLAEPKATWYQYALVLPSHFSSRLCSRFLWCGPDCLCLTPLLQGTPGGAWDYIDSDRVLAIKVSQNVYFLNIILLVFFSVLLSLRIMDTQKQ